MNISVNQHEVKNQIKNHSEITQGIGMTAQARKATGAKKDNQGVFFWDKKSNMSDSVMQKDKESKGKDLVDSISEFDEKNTKNYMVVMSNTMSSEDYAKLQEEGGSPANIDSKDMVTVMDEIKVTLAKAGVKIAGFTDDLDAEALANAGINDGYAAAISKAMEAKDLPITDENIKTIANQMDQASQILSLSDGAKQYILQNDLVPSVDTLYKANFIGKGQNLQEKNSFGIALDGYMTKTGTSEDIKAMEPQIVAVIEKTGLEVNENTKKEAFWLLENDLPLTSEKLIKLEKLNEITFPMNLNDVAMAVADGISVGLDKKDVDLTVTDGYLETAIAIEEDTLNVTDDELKSLILQNKNINLFNLFQEKSSSKHGNHHYESLSETGTIELVGEQHSIYQEARKELTNVQLLMSAQANLKLMKMGIHIDLEPLENLSSMLEKEEEVYHSTELSNVLSKTEEVKNLPVETIGISVKESWMANRVFNLDHVFETGKGIEASYIEAGKSYEKMMTAPRADLGDSIKTAFRNVDDILLESDMAVTEDNQRAVRICGYNQMEITEENINAIKEAHALLSDVVSKMSPEKALLMIREGINPMTMSLDELANYLSSKEDASENIEKYSKYLYRLEQNNDISAEEKEAYIGIYRLLRQIEKGDDQAIGAVIKNGQNLGFESLLSAVRTKKFGHIDSKIDDAFGLLSDLQKNGNSISDQINSYFNMKAGKIADELSSTVDFDLKETADIKDSAEITEALVSDGIGVTLNSLMAENALNTSENIYGKLYDSERKMKNKLSEDFGKGKEALLKSFDEATFEMKEVVENLSNESDSYLDVRAYAVDMRQISLITEHAKSESYYVPMEINEELTMVHIKIVNSEEKGRISIDLKGDDNGQGKAKIAISVKDDRIDALVGVYRKEDVNNFLEITNNCERELQNMGKTADISCVFSNTMTFDSFNKEGSDKTTTKELYDVAQIFLNCLKSSFEG